MKKFSLILSVLFLIACGEENETATRRDQLPVAGEETSAENRMEIPEPAEDGINPEEEILSEGLPKKEKEIAAVVAGRYRKIENDQPAADCNCHCIDISFDKETQWCIIEDKVYISARCEKTGENSADIYLTGVSRDENLERPIPWDKFDKSTPIASVVFQPDGSAELDWLGFSIDGELARDYAIYGKKTLEGTYKKD